MNVGYTGAPRPSAQPNFQIYPRNPLQIPSPSSSFHPGFPTNNNRFPAAPKVLEQSKLSTQDVSTVPETATSANQTVECSEKRRRMMSRWNGEPSVQQSPMIKNKFSNFSTAPSSDSSDSSSTSSSSKEKLRKKKKSVTVSEKMKNLNKKNYNPRDEAIKLEYRKVLTCEKTDETGGEVEEVPNPCIRKATRPQIKYEKKIKKIFLKVKIKKKVEVLKSDSIKFSDSIKIKC